MALVTGASAGIGWATCELLAEAGMRVVAIARRRERLEALQQHLVSRGVPIADFLPVVCDITKVCCNSSSKEISVTSCMFSLAAGLHMLRRLLLCRASSPACSIIRDFPSPLLCEGAQARSGPECTDGMPDTARTCAGSRGGGSAAHYC